MTATTKGAGEGVTRTLVAMMQPVDFATLPTDVRKVGLQCALDWFAATIAGADEALPKRLIAHALAEGGKPLSTVVAQPHKLSPLQAALINGTTSHMLDYDDVNLSMNGHPSAVVMPAVLAAAEPLNASGAELLSAFVAGYETAARVGLLVAPGHYARGYHATATIGAVAAAVGCAKLLRLNDESMARAIGIAVTQAAGLKSMFGTECKPFHAGLAAQSGLRAAQLAALGMESRADSLECRQGFASVFSPDFHPEAITGEPDRHYLLENLFKYDASCYGTHSALECVRRLKQQHGFGPADVKRVVVRVEKTNDAVCNIQEPKNGLEAKFSVRFITAMALAGADTSDLSIYSEKTAADPVLVAMRNRVTVEIVENRPVMETDMIVELNDGRTVSCTVDVGIPGTDYDTQGERLVAKFGRLVPPVLGDDQAALLLARLEGLEDIAVVDLMDAARRG
jgi:2-methylcitrate dehydratase PrpD